MILVDSSIWIDSFRQGDKQLDELVRARRVVTHALILDEIALGHLPRRELTLRLLYALPRIDSLGPEALRDNIERLGLVATGLGAVDAHLLAAAEAAGDLRLWSRDKRLTTHAERVGIAYSPS